MDKKRVIVVTPAAYLKLKKMSRRDGMKLWRLATEAVEMYCKAKGNLLDAPDPLRLIHKRAGAVYPEKLRV